MTSSTLYREGDQLESLLADLRAEYGDQIRVIDVEQVRPGGVRGLLARPRVAVRYRLVPEAAPTSTDPLAELIERAESREAAGLARPVPVPSIETATRESVGGNAEFASLLLDLAAQKAAARTAQPPAVVKPRPRPKPRAAVASAAAPLAAAPPAAAPPAAALPAPAPVAEVPQRSVSLVLRRELAELGVPIHLVPDDAADVQDAVRTIVGRLPAPPRPPAGPGRVLAIVGPAGAALATARELRDSDDVDIEGIWTIGVSRGQARGTTLLQDAWGAASAAEQHRERGGRLAVAVVPTDSSDDAARSSSRVLRALRPDAVWAVVDATRKPTDTRARLAAIELVDALVVIGAADTGSPATVLELDRPVAMLDGRPATAERWAAALADTVVALEQ
jgi:hypothetical protein